MATSPRHERQPTLRSDCFQTVPILSAASTYSTKLEQCRYPCSPKSWRDHSLACRHSTAAEPSTPAIRPLHHRHAWQAVFLPSIRCTLRQVARARDWPSSTSGRTSARLAEAPCCEWRGSALPCNMDKVLLAPIRLRIRWTAAGVVSDKSTDRSRGR